MTTQLEFTTEPCREVVNYSGPLDEFCKAIVAQGGRVEAFAPVRGVGWEVRVYWAQGKPPEAAKLKWEDNFPEHPEF